MLHILDVIEVARGVLLLQFHLHNRIDRSVAADIVELKSRASSVVDFVQRLAGSLKLEDVPGLVIAVSSTENILINYKILSEKFPFIQFNQEKVLASMS